MQGFSVAVVSGASVVAGGSAVVVASSVVVGVSSVGVGSAVSDVVVGEGSSQDRSGSSPS